MEWGMGEKKEGQCWGMGKEEILLCAAGVRGLPWQWENDGKGWERLPIHTHTHTQVRAQTKLTFFCLIK